MANETYEQMPAYFPRELPEDGNKRIFVEKTYEKPRDKEAQMSRLKRVGYVPDSDNSSDDADCLVIDEKIIKDRQKAREVKTTKDLLQLSKAGVEGELDELSTTKIMGPQNAEQFFEGPEPK